jgi:hypothetical protein
MERDDSLPIALQKYQILFVLVPPEEHHKPTLRTPLVGLQLKTM